MKTGENGHFEFLGQKVKILAFSHKKLFKNVILIIGNYTNDIRSKNFKKSNISEKNMVANFGFNCKKGKFSPILRLHAITRVRVIFFRLYPINLSKNGPI